MTPTNTDALKQSHRTDERYMHLALRLSAHAEGMTASNPPVGCVIVDRNGHVAGRGWTGKGGTPHAEAVALKQAGDAAAGSTAYVTLEPCCHHGRTPPCTDALIQARVARVIYGTTDPDARISGKGEVVLRTAGIEVYGGLLAEQARYTMRGYLSRQERGRPWITVKCATTWDGKIAAEDGSSQWITGSLARRHVHTERARVDALISGRATIQADDPLLTCRIDGMEDASPIRVILDTHFSLNPDDYRIFQDASHEHPVWWVGCTGAKPIQSRALPHGVEVIHSTAHGGQENTGTDLNAVVTMLAQRGINHALVESGGVLLAGFIHTGLADEGIWYRTPAIIGAQGHDAVAALGGTHITDRVILSPMERRYFDTGAETTVMERYAFTPPAGE